MLMSSLGSKLARSYFGLAHRIMQYDMSEFSGDVYVKSAFRDKVLTFVKAR